MLPVHWEWTNERCIFSLFEATVSVITASIYCSAALPFAHLWKFKQGLDRELERGFLPLLLAAGILSEDSGWYSSTERLKLGRFADC